MHGPTLSFRESGDPSGPVLVLLAGPTDSWRSYEPVLRLLPSSIRAVAVSQRGHGDSEKPPNGYGVEDLAGDVVALLDDLGVDRAVLAGHSGSCLVARRVALDHPERVAGLVLEASPTTLRDDPRLRQFVDEVVARVEDPVDPEVARSLVVSTSSASLDPDLVDVLTDEVRKVPAHVWRELFAGLLAYDDRAELGRIAARTLLVWGGADPLVPRAIAGRARAEPARRQARGVPGRRPHAPVGGRAAVRRRCRRLPPLAPPRLSRTLARWQS